MDEVQPTDYTCVMTPCNRFVYAWAVGGGDFYTPPDVGYMIGDEATIYLTLELKRSAQGIECQHTQTKSFFQLTYNLKNSDNSLSFLQ